MEGDKTKKVSDDSERRDNIPGEDLAEMANGEFGGVHILGEEDTKKHFGPPDNKDSDSDEDQLER